MRMLYHNVSSLKFGWHWTLSTNDVIARQCSACKIDTWLNDNCWHVALVRKTHRLNTRRVFETLNTFLNLKIKITWTWSQTPLDLFDFEVKIEGTVGVWDWSQMLIRCSRPTRVWVFYNVSAQNFTEYWIVLICAHNTGLTNKCHYLNEQNTSKICRRLGGQFCPSLLRMFSLASHVNIWNSQCVLHQNFYVLWSFQNISFLQRLELRHFTGNKLSVNWENSEMLKYVVTESLSWHSLNSDHTRL